MIPGQGTKSHIAAKSLHAPSKNAQATTKTWRRQINKYLKKFQWSGTVPLRSDILART